MMVRPATEACIGQHFCKGSLSVQGGAESQLLRDRKRKRRRLVGLWEKEHRPRPQKDVQGRAEGENDRLQTLGFLGVGNREAEDGDANLIRETDIQDFFV
jgi:hypothetical protein